MVFSSDGQTLVGNDKHSNTLRLWNVPPGTLQHTLEHPDSVTSVAFSPDGRTLASRDYENLYLWDAATGTLQHTLDHAYAISVTFSPDGRTLVSGDRSTVWLWDTATGSLHHIWEHRAGNKHMVFSPDGRTLATGGDGGIVRLWEAATGTLQHTLNHAQAVYSMAFSPDGRDLATGGDYNTLRLWDTATGTLQHTLEGHRHWVIKVAFSPDGRILASSDLDGSIRLWDAATGILQHTLEGHTSPESDRDWAGSMAFSPDGRTLVGIGGDHTVRLWDVATGTLRHAYEGHADEVYSVAFSPDGRTLASSSQDATILLWDLTLRSASGTFRNLTTNPDGRWTVRKKGTTVTASFSSPRAPVQYHAHQDMQPQFVLPVEFRPASQVHHTVTGTRVHADRTPVPSAQPVTFNLTIGTNGEMHYVNNPKVDNLGYVNYHVTHLTWQTREASGDFRNLTTNPGGRWTVWKSGTTVTASFSSPRAPVQYHARQDPQPQFVLPVEFRPAIPVEYTVSGWQVNTDRMPVPVTFDLTIGTNGEMHYVDNSKMDDLGYVSYRVTHLIWQTREAPETPSTTGTGTTSGSDIDPNQ